MTVHPHPPQLPHVGARSRRTHGSRREAVGGSDDQGLAGRRLRPSEIVERVGGSYARQLGIDLSSGQSAEIQKWFIAAMLFGARISETIAVHTYREFERAGVLSWNRIVDAGWDRLVELLDRGGYVRYDFKTATKLLHVSQALGAQYKGDLNILHERASDTVDLVQRIRALGKGIGDVTVNIFLRELRGIWAKANPLPSARVIRAARALELISARLKDPARTQQKLMDAWLADGMNAADFSEFEAALVRAAAILCKQ